MQHSTEMLWVTNSKQICKMKKVSNQIHFFARQKVWFSLEKRFIIIINRFVRKLVYERFVFVLKLNHSTLFKYHDGFQLSLTSLRWIRLLLSKLFLFCNVSFLNLELLPAVAILQVYAVKIAPLHESIYIPIWIKTKKKKNMEKLCGWKNISTVNCMQCTQKHQKQQVRFQ